MNNCIKLGKIILAPRKINCVRSKFIQIRILFFNLYDPLGLELL